LCGPHRDSRFDAEKVEFYDGLLAYAGTYTVEGDRVTHSIEAS
jgi:hypothetical protein